MSLPPERATNALAPLPYCSSASSTVASVLSARAFSNCITAGTLMRPQRSTWTTEGRTANLLRPGTKPEKHDVHRSGQGRRVSRIQQTAPLVALT